MSVLADNSYIEWCRDSHLAVFFNKIPNVRIRYVVPFLSGEEIKDIKKKPFVNKDVLKVVLCDFDKDKKYPFEIEDSYKFDGASIPRAFWRFIGPSTDNTFLTGAMVHDKLCENHEYVDNDRNFSSRVFRALLLAGGVSVIKAQIMYLAVDIFQRFCHWCPKEK